MQSRKSPFLSIVIIIGLIISYFLMVDITVSAATVSQEPPPPIQPQAFDEQKLDVFIHEQTGKVRFIAASAQEPIRINSIRSLSGGVDPEFAARAFLDEQGALFGLRNQASELTLLTEFTDEYDRSFERFQQVYQGIPILGGELIVQLDQNQNVISANGEILPDIDEQILEINISADEASELAINLAAKQYGYQKGALSTTAPELWIYSPKIFSSSSGPTQLVWKVEVTTQDSPSPIKEMVLVGSKRGELVLNFNQVPDAKEIIVYDAENTTTLMKSLACQASDCSDGDADEVAAWTYANQIYDLYKDYHNRDSFNNLGEPIRSSVHYQIEYQNAFWSGYYSLFVFGDGMVTDDIFGHEFTHAVTDYSSKLFYFAQSGAINESFSDIWGEFLDQTNGMGDDRPEVKWMVGEEVGGIRSMSDPMGFDNTADKMTSPNFYLGLSDNAGVHWNSGVGNKAAYLLAEGDTFNGYTVTGLGLPKVAAIYYDVQTKYLVSGSDYQDLGDALYFACRNLIGSIPNNSTVITNDDCQQVFNATHAVEMEKPARGLASKIDAPYCDNGVSTPTDIYFKDDFENNLGKWEFTGISNVWSRDGYADSLGPNAHSGLHYAYADDIYLNSDASMQMANSIILPANAYLHFWQSYDLELGWDGGFIEFSTDGGATWNDASSLFINNAYDQHVYSLDRNGFTGSNYGYQASRLDLSSLAGQSVRFRWRLTTDSSSYRWGWWLDDIKIYTCNKIINDDFINGQWIDSIPYENTGLSTRGATQESSDPMIPACGLQSGTNTVWYKYTPGANGLIYLDTFSSNYDTYIAVFKDNVDTSSLVSCNDDFDPNTLQSKVEIPVIADETYFFQIGQFSGYLPSNSSSNPKEVPDSQFESGGDLSFHATNFKDVPGNYWAWKWIERFYGQRITAGCGTNPRMYCPDRNVSRAEMAVFLLRSKYGSGYLPPNPINNSFKDVPENYWASRWIEQLSKEGITSGCGGGYFCPDSQVTRAQMAVFLLRSKYGSGYLPPVPTTDPFNDVSQNHWAAKYIKQLAVEGVTSGCGGGNFCPDNPVTRAQMAIFLIRNFDLE